MTAREFLEWAGFTGELEYGLYWLSQYVDKGSFYLQFPDAEVTTEDGDSLSESPDEPANFQEYMKEEC